MYDQKADHSGDNWKPKEEKNHAITLIIFLLAILTVLATYVNSKLLN